ncbi:DNA polymerase IV [Marivirga atlantica]|uniref:DNA polymerase IV n=1 Tax=Marivirga atlantica TaxID=1548457 RepID=A0A937DJE2_9BACT|nr:DNA polymerase IV [Marivirga atlantica]MBL0765905.1 DNA polymerase IV [Marivirga atlantica]
MTRKIIHIDMDAFYASVEQLDFPELRGKPIAVGGNKERGVVAAASYEARKYGVHSAMPSKIAASKCKDLIFVKARFDRYTEISRSIREIFLSHTDLVEPLSLDEAYLDVTQNKQGIETATDIAISIKKQIKEELGLTASAGVSVNKFLAKIASDYRKPDGLYIIKPHQVERFIEQLPIKKFFGVGKVTAEKMHKMGIFHGRDLKEKSLQTLTNYFGKAGKYYYEVSRGIDNRSVNPNRIRKSIGAENTFSESLATHDELKEKMYPIIEKVWERYQKAKAKAHTQTLKVKYDDFTQITRSKTTDNIIKDKIAFEQAIDALIDQVELEQKVRLIGCSLSNFELEEETEKTKQEQQLTLRF